MSAGDTEPGTCVQSGPGDSPAWQLQSGPGRVPGRVIAPDSSLRSMSLSPRPARLSGSVQLVSMSHNSWEHISVRNKAKIYCRSDKKKVHLKNLQHRKKIVNVTEMRCDRFTVLTEWPAAATSVSRAQAPGRGSVWAGLGGWAGQGTDSFSLWRAGARVLHCHDMQRQPVM